MHLAAGRSEIVRKTVHSRKKVRWQQDKPYEVDTEEVAEFSRKLRADLRKESNDPTRIEEKKVDSVEGNSNARNDHRIEEEEDAEDTEGSMRFIADYGGMEMDTFFAKKGKGI
ncbi:hypothetical protein BGX38DRAFT_1147374 [Terfezia claveryi]|nr:hypothetical protein BGX38DRAFT_1147374 [Terfezia claveryi]